MCIHCDNPFTWSGSEEIECCPKCGQHFFPKIIDGLRELKSLDDKKTFDKE